MRIIIILFVLFFASDTFGQDIFRQVAEMVNDERQNLGLKRLSYDKQLEQAALSQARWMADVGKMLHLRGEAPKTYKDWMNCDHHHVNRILKSGYIKVEDIFDITVRPDNSGVNINSKPYADDMVSEIIAYAGPNNGTVIQQLPIIVKGWMRSPGHRAVVVKTSFEDIGGAIAMSRNGSVYYCITFGKKP